MVKVKIEWSRKNLTEYLKYTTFFGKKSIKLAGIMFVLCYILVLAICLTAFFAMGYLFMLIMALILTAFVAVYALFFAFTVKSYVKKALKANEESEYNNVIIGNDDILVLKDDDPIGKIGWENMVNIYFNEKMQSAYLSTVDNAVLILEYRNVIEGSAQELKEILTAKKAKNDKLSKKA